MTIHHEYGFSKWPALKICPHYMATDKSSDASESGTKNHEDLADIINEINTGTPALHESEDARWAANFIGTIAKKEFINSEYGTKIPDGSMAHGVFGTCDAWVSVDGTLHVFDYKSGAMGTIDYMPQVMGYAYSLCLEDDIASRIDLNNVFCHVLFGASRDVVGISCPFAELEANAREVMSNVNMRENLSPVCNGYCRYCKHAMNCSALTGNLVALHDNTLATMSDARKYEWISAAKSIIEQEMDRIKQAAIENGGVIQDGNIRYEIRTDSRGKMKTIDVNKLYSDSKQYGSFDWMSNVTISRKAFSSMVKTALASEGRKISAKELDSLYDGCCTFGEPASRMIRTEA